jgi:transcriptional regulator with XRE-family HTH domain
MKINRSLILTLRKQQSWSQDELAVAAGLNLRTVQRIERSGSASLQSRKALAAAFDIDVNDLGSPEEAMTTRPTCPGWVRFNWTASSSRSHSFSACWRR